MAACPLDPERDLGRHGTSETPFVALTSEMRGKVTIGAGEPAPRDGHQKSDGPLAGRGPRAVAAQIPAVTP
jgi:hypothetical protein